MSGPSLLLLVLRHLLADLLRSIEDAECGFVADKALLVLREMLKINIQMVRISFTTRNMVESVKLSPISMKQHDFPQTHSSNANRISSTPSRFFTTMAGRKHEAQPLKPNSRIQHFERISTSYFQSSALIHIYISNRKFPIYGPILNLQLYSTLLHKEERKEAHNWRFRVCIPLEKR